MEGYNQQLYKRLFDHLDENGDGKISALELIGKDMSLEEAEAVHDGDNDGLMDFEDLVEDGGTEVELKEAFRMYEMEGCGYITPESLKRMLHRLGETRSSVDDCKRMIAKYE